MIRIFKKEREKIFMMSEFVEKLKKGGKDIEENVKKILKCIIKVASREYTPKPFLYGNTDFQFTRGLLGVSM